MTSEALVRCENVSKKFCRNLKRSLLYGAADSIADMLGGRSTTSHQQLRKNEFWANREISFSVGRGECVGLIGGNGAGKTTLLKMLNGLIKPDTGRITLRGRVGGLIALGAGFNPILTGRENIFINGSVIGLSQKQIRDRFEEIVDFAELSDAIDAPVRTYSSGMQVRLGFSIAAVLSEPDVLILDEVLAVGDAGFQIKCVNRLREIREDAAVILVSHSMQTISAFCQRVKLLHKGQLVDCGDSPAEAIGAYHGLNGVSDEGPRVSGTGLLDLNELQIFPSDHPVPTSNGRSGNVSISHGTSVSAVIRMDLHESLSENEVRLSVISETQSPVATFILRGTGSSINSAFLEGSQGERELIVDLGEFDFNSGNYGLLFSVADIKTGAVNLRVENAAQFSIVDVENTTWAPVVRTASLRTSSNVNSNV